MTLYSAKVCVKKPSTSELQMPSPLGTASCGLPIQSTLLAQCTHDHDKSLVTGSQTERHLIAKTTCVLTVPEILVSLGTSMFRP